MNLTISVIMLKTLFITGVTVFILPLASSLNLIQSLITGLALSFFLYAGDLLILPRMNIPAATAADITITVLILWTSTWFFGGVGLTIPTSLFLALIIGAGEWFLHRYLRVSVKAR